MTRSLFKCSYSGITLDPEEAVTFENKIYHKKTYDAWTLHGFTGKENEFITNELQNIIFNDVFCAPNLVTSALKKKIILNIKVLVCWLLQLDPQRLLLTLQKNIETIERHLSENENHVPDLCDSVLDLLQTCLVNIFNHASVIEIISSIDEINSTAGSNVIESAIWRYVILSNGVVAQTNV